MHRILPLLLGVAAVWGALSSFSGVRNALRVDAAEQASVQSRLESPRSPDGTLLAWTGSAEEALTLSIEAAEASPTLRNTVRAVGWTREKARLSADPGQRVPLLCRALSLYGGALLREPYNSDLLLGWASTRQLLGTAQCAETGTSGSFEVAVEEALKWNPYDHDVVFGGALLELWSGRRERALSLFQRLLTYTPALSSGEESVILGELRSAKDAQSVIPTQLPQVVRWSKLLQDRRPADFIEWHAALGGLQRAALADAQARVRAKAFPADLYQKSVLQLLGLAAEDSVRQQLDMELSLLSRQRGDLDAAEFFATRAAMKRLSIAPSAISGDTRNIAPFVRWGGNEVTFLDDFSESAGFYLAAQQGVSMIVLRSLSGKSGMEPGAIRVLAGDDNEHWTEVSPKGIKVVKLDPETLFVVTVPTEAHRYWKVHGRSAQRERSFGAPLRDLVTAYGNTARKRGEG